MKGILIQLDNGDTEQISVKEYKNSKELINLLSELCERDDTVKLKIWTKELKYFMIVGLFITIGFLVMKIFS